MPAQFASCPCCGMSVPFSALNFDTDGVRNPEPKRYGTFVKTRGQEPGTGRVQWSIQDMPLYMLEGLRLQLADALVLVDQQIRETT